LAAGKGSALREGPDELADPEYANIDLVNIEELRLNVDKSLPISENAIALLIFIFMRDVHANT
jgi:hypothetical protein